MISDGAHRVARVRVHVREAEGARHFGAQDDAAYVIDAEGAVRWRFEAVDAPPTLLWDGSLLVASDDGTIAMLLP